MLHEGEVELNFEKNLKKKNKHHDKHQHLFTTSHIIINI